MSARRANDSLCLAQRIALAAAGLLLVSLLATAAALEPSPSGLGTHRQLGLPPCTIKALLKIPCPLCGMTTSWAHLVRGQIASAVAANCAGAVLASWAMAAVPWTTVSAARGRCWLYCPTAKTLLPPVLALVLLATLQWLFRLWLN